MDDRKLAERARRGDLAAFSELIQHYQELAFRAAYLITGNPADAEDAMQEAFLKAYAALDRFQPGRPFRPWLLRIVTNEARNRRRTSQRGRQLQQRLTAQAFPADAQPAPDTALLAAEQRERLFAALSQLPEPDQIVLAYHYFLDFSVSEVAEILDTKPSTVRSRLLRARQRLRERITEDTNEPRRQQAANNAAWKESTDE